MRARPTLLLSAILIVAGVGAFADEAKTPRSADAILNQYQELEAAIRKMLP